MSDDELDNISMSIPFEFVGNYGWFAGVLSFGVLGVFRGIERTGLWKHWKTMMFTGKDMITISRAE